MPPGVPHAVSPNPEKLELSRLKEDVSKYRPWISSSSADVWETIMAKDLDDYLSPSENGDEWVMDDVFQQDHPSSPNLPEQTNNSAEIAAMLAAELESCQVIIFYIQCIIIILFKDCIVMLQIIIQVYTMVRCILNAVPKFRHLYTYYYAHRQQSLRCLNLGTAYTSRVHADA